MIRFIIICLVFFCFLIPLKVVASSAYPSKTEIMKQWPKADAVIRSFHTTIEFYFDEQTKMPQVKQTDKLELVPLSNEGLERLYTYNNQSRLGKVMIREEDQKKVRMTVVCGDWESDGIFHSDRKFCHYRAFVGNDADYYVFSAEKHFNDLRYFAKDFLNDPFYPVLQRRYEVIIPDWLDLEIKDFNFDHFTIDRSEELIDNGRKIIFEGSDLKAANNDQFFLSAEHSYPHLLFLCKSYQNENSEEVALIGGLQDLFEWYVQLVGDLPTDEEALQPMLDQILATAGTRNDSIKSIYYWVQDNIRYVAFLDGIAGYRPDPASKVLKNKYGDCKGMSSLLKSMLEMAGFDARLAWMGTRHLPYNYSTPCLAVDNHMICYLRDGEKDYFLDATQDMIPLGQNGENIQGKQVLINNGDDYILKNIPIAEAAENTVTTNATLQIKGSSLTGDVLMTYKGDSRSILLNTLAHMKNTNHENFVQKVLLDNSKYEINKLKLSDIKEREQDLRISFNTTMDGLVTSFGNEFFITPDIWNDNNKFAKDTTDIYHLDIGKKLCSNVSISILLPNDLKAIYVPENKVYSDGPFSFSVSYQLKEQKLVYERSIQVETSVIDKSQFKAFFTFMDYYHKARSQAFELVAELEN